MTCALKASMFVVSRFYTLSWPVVYALLTGIPIQNFKLTDNIILPSNNLSPAFPALLSYTKTPLLPAELPAWLKLK